MHDYTPSPKRPSRSWQDSLTASADRIIAVGALNIPRLPVVQRRVGLSKKSRWRVRVMFALLVMFLLGFVLGLRRPTGEFTPVAFNPDVAEFHGVVKTEWVRGESAMDTRRFKLLAPVEYVASDETVWKAEPGTVINGASIPRAFWSVIGAPTTGPYRDASVIHDYYCGTRERHWEATHWVFYDACRASGLGPWKANVMYLAVYHYGPMWDEDGNLLRGTVDIDKPTAKRMRDFCEANPELTLPELESLDPGIWEQEPETI